MRHPITHRASRKMNRSIEPELLDELPADDPRAVRSRRDLVRLNAWMGNASILARAMRAIFPEPTPRRIIEIGAGDGKLMLDVAKRLGAKWKGAELILVDQHNLLTADTRARFHKLGWSARAESADAFDWLQQPGASGGIDMIAANLFLHHFSQNRLAELFRCAARTSRAFVAVEPRRSRSALFFSRLVWMIGCGPVTRHDSPVSVRAGFCDAELTQLWPVEANWEVNERRAGLFSHLFTVRRKE
jgi:hypothetical protein